MYSIHHRRSSNTPNDFCFVGEKWLYKSLAEAKQGRTVSGDLVVHYGTRTVVNDTEWLFPWEKADRNCYAQQAMRHDNVGALTP